MWSGWVGGLLAWLVTLSRAICVDKARHGYGKCCCRVCDAPEAPAQEPEQPEPEQQLRKRRRFKSAP